MCGLFGKIASNTQKLEIEKLNVLGVLNDERGGDSVGLYIDGEIEYGVSKQKLYFDFMMDSELIKNTKEARIVLGHTRKASIGGISKETAQPVCIRDKNENIEMVLIHNGTIFNYLELAEEYIPHIEIKGMTDTQVMAHIFYNCGYDVLEKYQGAAVFIIVDYRKVKKDGAPKVLMYKGASSKYVSSTVMDEERPLFITKSNDSIWFSSIGSMLPAINYPLEVLSLKPNILVEVKSINEGITLDIIKEIDRSKRFQYKSVVQQTNEYSRYGTGNNSYNNSTSKANTSNSSKTSKASGITNWIDVTSDYVVNRVSLHTDGLYYMNNKLVNGVLSVDKNGYTYTSKFRGISKDDYWFYQGRLLPGERVYTLLSQIESEYNLTKEDMSQNYSECIDKYSYIPVINVVYNSPVSVEVFSQEDFMETKFFNGTIKPIFSYNSFKFTVKDGIVTAKDYDVSSESNIGSFRIFKALWDESGVDWNKEIKKLRNHINVNP